MVKVFLRRKVRHGYGMPDAVFKKQATLPTYPRAHDRVVIGGESLEVLGLEFVLDSDSPAVVMLQTDLRHLGTYRHRFVELCAEYVQHLWTKEAANVE